MKDTTLVTCKICQARVRKDRIQRHKHKVHNNKSINKKIDKSRLTQLQNHLNYFYSLMESNLRYYFPEQFNYTKVKILTLMYLEWFAGYSFSEINITHKNKIDESLFRKKCILIKPIFKKIVSHIHRKSLNRAIDHEPDWRVCNTYEPIFGHKYLGFTVRENRNQKFGTFCLHDDYSEESDPEGLMNLDY